MSVRQPWRLHPGTISRAFLPPAPLRQHLVCVIERDTRGCDLHPLQAFTYGPATPNMSITWLWQGQTERLLEWRPDDLQAPRERLNASILIRGGTTKPWITYSEEPLHALIAVFRPNALHHLFGLKPSEWMDQLQPLEACKLDPAWLRWARQILAVQSSSAALPLLYAGLERQLASDLSSGPHPELANRWLTRLENLAGNRSQRTLQRWIKQQTGTTARQLDRFIRFEQLGLVVGNVFNNQQRQVPQADLAASTGFSDQSHMAREVKHALGFSVGDGLRRFFLYESFWLFRTKLRLHR